MCAFTQLSAYFSMDLIKGGDIYYLDSEKLSKLIHSKGIDEKIRHVKPRLKPYISTFKAPPKNEETEKFELFKWLEAELTGAYHEEVFLGTLIEFTDLTGSINIPFAKGKEYKEIDQMLNDIRDFSLIYMTRLSQLGGSEGAQKRNLKLPMILSIVEIYIETGN